MLPDLNNLPDNFDITYHLANQDFIGSDITNHLSELLSIITEGQISGKISIEIASFNRQIDITFFSVLTLIVSQSPNTVVDFILKQASEEDKNYFRIRAKLLNFIYSCRLTVGKRNFYLDRKSTRLNSSHPRLSRMPSSA